MRFRPPRTAFRCILQNPVERPTAAELVQSLIDLETKLRLCVAANQLMAMSAEGRGAMQDVPPSKPTFRRYWATAGPAADHAACSDDDRGCCKGLPAGSEADGCD
jgi:hypothetical protein